MDASYITVPIIMTLVIGFATQLEAVAEDTSAKALAFSDDMNKAMDCATRGIPISICAPNLTETNFTGEKEAFLDTLQAFQEEMQKAQEEQTQNITS